MYIVLVTLILLVILILFIDINSKSNFESIKNDERKIVVIFKSHLWSNPIEKTVLRILSETKNSKIDFFILLHSNDGQLAKQIRNEELKKHIIVFHEEEIITLYPNGFFNLWLCNHWILMWFFKRYSNYDYYWSMEYDVRISGNGAYIWNYSGNEDFVYPIPEFQNDEWTWKDYYTGNKLSDETKWYGYLQLTRYSRRFLKYLDMYFSTGENGQDEMIIYSLFKRGQKEIGLEGNHEFLNNLIDDSWSVDPAKSPENKKIFRMANKEYRSNPEHLTIIHPIK